MPSAAKVLAELTQRRASAQAKVDDLERQQRAASEAAAAASAKLADLERRALGGQKVSRRETSCAEQTKRVNT